MPPVLASLLGIVAILAFAFLLSNAKTKIRLRVVVSAFALQALLAFLVLRTPGGRMVASSAERLPPRSLTLELRQVRLSVARRGRTCSM